MPIPRILFPADLSNRSLGMIPYVKAIAAKYNAEVTLLYVASPLYPIPATGYTGPAYIPVPKEVLAEERTELEKFGADLLQGIKVRHMLYEGDPAPQILECVKSEGIDLIAMPTHGRGDFRRFLIGSVTAKVLHDVPCPVLTGAHLKEPAGLKASSISNVLCAVDLGGQSADVINYASQLASDFHARLNFVHAVPTDPLLSTDWREEAVNVARLGLDAVLSANRVTGADTCIEEGESAHVVCSVAEKIGADLVVIGRGPQDGHFGRFTEHAYGIIRQSPCPVISI